MLVQPKSKNIDVEFLIIIIIKWDHGKTPGMRSPDRLGKGKIIRNPIPDIITSWVHENIINIGDPLETDMPDRRPIGDPSENDMPVWRPMGDLDMLHQRTIWNRHAPSKTDMPDRQPIEVSDVSPQAYWSPMGHVGLLLGMSVSDGVCWSPRSLRSGMSVSDGACWSPISHLGLRCVSDRSPIVIIFSWTQKLALSFRGRYHFIVYGERER